MQRLLLDNTLSSLTLKVIIGFLTHIGQVTRYFDISDYVLSSPRNETKNISFSAWNLFVRKWIYCTF